MSSCGYTWNVGEVAKNSFGSFYSVDEWFKSVVENGEASDQDRAEKAHDDQIIKQVDEGPNFIEIAEARSGQKFENPFNTFLRESTAEIIDTCEFGRRLTLKNIFR